ncbi:hypothetical protein L198_04136 [Cryptococcus wingfieldii CBS 7118]|uniref:Structure-specific endonuclease subunit SLX4 n=1 Tax=Cryptococcus wingfieldii CBS 7118 TaxID=1295528 RepID=A0A1E3J6F6_9TREE|nr:hypothetical protein L198_04136 [Cryptococcus wingfieldii CBS 7118]ODN96422.1 hypothetical protein L198_04136 [Cryptococcus wingfieldii CBS 7118]
MASSTSLLSTSPSSSDEPQFIGRSSSSSKATAAPRPIPHQTCCPTQVVQEAHNGVIQPSRISSMKSLAHKYNFNDSGPSSGTVNGRSQVRHTTPGSESEDPPLRARTHPRQKKASQAIARTRPATQNTTLLLPGLLPDLISSPAPVPDWLGRTAVLLKLKDCPVCRTRWKGKESGMFRWRHISTCRPPLYRSPNAPPNLQQMIHDALSVRSAPNTLLELHAGSIAQAEGALAAQGSSNGLASVTSVKRSDLRGEAWDDEVIDRIRGWIGHSSPPPLFNQATSAYNIDPPPPSNSHRRTSQNDADRVPYLATQPMGRSDLAQDYLKQEPSPPVIGSTSSEEGDSVPLSDDSEILVPASDSDSDEELPLEVKKPFQEAAFAGLGKDVEHDVQEPPDVAIVDVERKIKRTLDSPIGGLHAKLSRLSITPEAHLWTQHEVSPSSTLKCAPVSPVLERSTTPTAPYTRSFVDVDGWGAFAFENDDPVAILSWEPKASEPDSASDLDILGYQAENSGTQSHRASGVMITDSDGHLPVGDGGEDAELLANNNEAMSLISIDDHMPAYELWDVKDLQARYGYRPVKNHTVLVRLAIECWKALAADPESPSSPPGPLLDSATWSVAVQSLPGGQMGDIAETEDPQATEMSCQKVKKPEVEEDLDQVFYGVIKEDFDLYLRVLRYEPLSLDELISKSLRAGITKKGWKAHLKRYLDLQSITYFTEDPTKQRQRH